MDSSNNTELKQKIKGKINEKRIQRGVTLSVSNNNLNNDEILMVCVKSMMKDVQLPQIKKIKFLMEKSKILEKKYKPLRDKFEPIYMSILKEELTIDNIGMLEMMLKRRDSIQNKKISIENADEQMKEYLYNLYKMDN